ncbi:MAG: trypsin-like peptidase domain-containing protein [Planktothrix sp.]
MKIQEYERAIVRIFDKKNNKVGSGFLVAPGYVLTCSHVVLQAIGINIQDKDYDFASHQNPPAEAITLDFPVEATDKIFYAEVVSWLPYHVDSGDVAALKISGTIPETIKPILINPRKNENFTTNEHYFACSYVDGGGVKSSPYLYEAQSNNHRLLFKMLQGQYCQPIKGGFSGAPIWSDQLGIVVGMLATAENEGQYAIAISRESLDSSSCPILESLDSSSCPILEQLRAYSLADLLQDYLRELKDPDYRIRIEGAIASALRYVNPDQGLNEENTRHKQLASLCTLPPRGWEGVDLLTQFAVFLSLENISAPLLEKLEKWVGYWREDWAELLARANRERKKCHPSSESSNQHLIIEAIRVEQSEKEIVRFSIWKWENKEISPTKWNNEEILLEELPAFLYKNLGYHNHTLHIFVNWYWLHLDLSDRHVNNYEVTLGSKYKMVMRLNLQHSHYQKIYYENCWKKWQLLKEKLYHPAKEIFIQTDCLNLKKNHRKLRRELDIAEMAILQNLEEAEVGNFFFDFIVQTTAIPVALWSRKIELCSLVESVLDCQVHEIPEQIRLIRENTSKEDKEDDDCIGRHLTLLWEDPNILPPSIPYNSEA